MHVILDKSYLDGSSTADIRDLAEKARLIISAALFHELTTTSPESRVRCFSKLPQGDNPVELFERIGNLSSIEMDNHKPAGLPSQHLLQKSFRFNPGLCATDYEFPPENLRAIEEKRITVEQSIDDLLQLSDTIPNIFPELTTGSTEQRLEALRQAHALIVDPTKVSGFLGQLTSPDPNRPFPQITGNPEQWAMVVWLQVRLLLVTDLYFRYQGRLASVMTPKLRVRLEHDVHDAEVLALGVLQGAFATRENKLRAWFKLLKPDGTLFPSDG